MKKLHRQALIISKGSDRAGQWCKLLAEHGWKTEVISSLSELSDSLMKIAPRVLIIESAPDLHLSPESLKKIYQECDESIAMVPVLEQASARDVLDFIHNGASDVLLEPVKSEEMLRVVDRVAQSQQIVREKRQYRSKLELINRELMDSLRILRQDQIAGRQVQQSMLPKTPQKHHGYTIAHHIIPSLFLSGDFVGYHLLMDRYLTFYFADVSGHGASSAFVTVLIRFMLNGIIRKHVLRRDEDKLAEAPLGLAESLNRQLLATELDKHCTLFAGMIDTRRNVMRYVLASQFPAPVIIEDGQARRLEGKGKPLGIFEDASWDVHELRLAKDFSLCVVSDGIFDYMEGDDMMEKEDRLFGAIAGNAGSFQQIQQALELDEIKEAPDDISLLYIKRDYFGK